MFISCLVRRLQTRLKKTIIIFVILVASRDYLLLLPIFVAQVVITRIRTWATIWWVLFYNIFIFFKPHLDKRNPPCSESESHLTGIFVGILDRVPSCITSHQIKHEGLIIYYLLWMNSHLGVISNNYLYVVC